MGLLDNMNFDDPQTQGLLMAAAQMMQASGNPYKPATFGSTLGAGIQGGMEGYQGALAQKSKLEAQKQMTELHNAEMEKYRQKVLQEKALQEQTARAHQLISNQGDNVDYQSLYRQGVPIDMLKQLAESRTLGRDKVARVEEIAGENGQKIKQQLDDYGRPVGQGMQGYVSPVEVGLGDRKTFAIPTPGMLFKMGQSPDSAARLRQDDSHFKANQAKESAPQFNADVGGFIVKPSKNTPNGGIIPLNGFSPKLSEDQGKATSWLVQAENSYKNMQDALSKNKNASKPGFNDVIAATPSFGIGGVVGNAFRSDDRQKFMQSSSSLSEALLRAATGAGITKDEAEQKIKEITPQFGDGDALIGQKLDAIPLYIDSLKVRAGSGAKKADSIMSAQKQNQLMHNSPKSNMDIHDQADAILKGL